MGSISREEFNERVKKIESISMIDYLIGKGFKIERHGRVYRTLSPWTEENVPSCYFYPETNKFIDFSSGKRGNLIDFVRWVSNLSIGNAIQKIIDDELITTLPTKEWKPPKKREKLDLGKYTSVSRRQKRSIRAYADKRGIPRECYRWGWIGKPCMIFLHEDCEGKVTGFKARFLNNEEPRFTARGSLNYYILENDSGFGKKRLYVTESETSSAALYAFLKSIHVNFVILCVGGVNSMVKSIPDKYCNLSDRYLVIDYDGNEKLYQERLQNFEHLNCKDVKIPVEKGEDINSLYVKGMIGKYTSEILK